MSNQRKISSLNDTSNISVIAFSPLPKKIGQANVATTLSISTLGNINVARSDGNTSTPIQQTLNLYDLNALTANVKTLMNGNINVHGNLLAGNAITTMDSNYDIRMNGYLHLGVNNDYDMNKLGAVTITTDDSSNIFSMAFVRKENYVWQMGYKSDGTNDFYIHDGAMGMKLTATNSQAWSSVSDERFKKNIVEIDNCLERIYKMKGVYYNYKIEDKDAPRKIGVIAQDVYSQFPELVDVPKNSDEAMSVRYSELTPVLLNGIKELYDLYKELKNEIENMK